MSFETRKVNGDSILTKVFSTISNLGHALFVRVTTVFGDASVTFKRPNNTDAYAINDVVGPNATAVQEFANVAEYNGQWVTITEFLLRKSNTTITSGAFRVLFFNAAPTAIADNSQWTTLAANASKYLGFLDVIFTSQDTPGTGSDEARKLVTDLNLNLKCAANSTSLFAVTIALAAYTPTANEVFVEKLSAIKN